MECSNPIEISDVSGTFVETFCESLTPPEGEMHITLTEGTSFEKKNDDYTKEIRSSSPRSYRHRLYATLPSSSYSSLMPYQVPQVRQILKACFPQGCKKIVDATAHIGGDSILFAETFPQAKIISIDIDFDAVECLKNNISNFATPSQFDVVCENSVKWIHDQSELPKGERPGEADFYYFDPPWGGPKYYSKKEIYLTLDQTYIEVIINTVFAFGLSEYVLLKVPRNFAYPFFKSAVKGVCKLFYIKKPQKNGAIAYGLILVHKSCV